MISDHDNQLYSTVDAGYKNTLGSRKDVLITGMFHIGNARTVFQEMVLDGSYNRCSYIRHPLYYVDNTSKEHYEEFD